MSKFLWRVFDSLNKALLVAAYTHITILFFSLIFFRSTKFMNVFYILDLHYFLPWIDQGYWSLFGGQLIFSLIFLGFFVVGSRKQAKEHAKIAK